jgi:hypothetical protein
MSFPRRAEAERSVFALFLLGLCAFVLFTSTPAAAAGIVGKDGKIHACYKAKGRGKGTLRVVRSAKAKCPKKWKKTSWYASGQAGPQGAAGAPGGNGETGTNGGSGLPGTTGTVTVKALEDKVTELLTKVQSLETILKGINNQQLQEAIAAVPVVGELCGQAKALNEQSTALGGALSGLSTVVDTLTLMGLPTVPTALPPFECP